MYKLLLRHPEVPHHFMSIAQGGVFVKPTAVETLLGSCVSVTFFSPGKKIGAMFHALLPHPFNGAKPASDGSEDFKFVDTAVERCVRMLAAKGVDPREAVCKVFGGANSLLPGEMGMGKRNVEAAFAALTRLRLRPHSVNVGGLVGRKILFLTGLGDVYVKAIKKKAENGNARKK